MKKITAAFPTLCILLVFCVALGACRRTDVSPETDAPDLTIGDMTEGKVTQESGFDPSYDLSEFPIIDSARDDTVGITWYFDSTVVRTLKDNIIYVYIGVYDNGRVSFRVRMQYFGEEKLGVDRFRITAGSGQYEVRQTVSEGDNGTYCWEWMDFIPDADELETVRAVAKADGEIKVRAYSGSDFKERLMGDGEHRALRNILFIYESIIGSDITYPVDIMQAEDTTAPPVSGTETEAPIYDDFADNISSDGGVSVLNYYDYTISFPSSYYCGHDAESGAVSIASTENSAEKIELVYAAGTFKADSVTDEVVSNSLKILQAQLPDASVSIYTGSTPLTVGGRPAVKYAYKIEFDTATVYVTQYLVEYSDGCYSIAVAETAPGGEVFTAILSSLSFK